MKLDRLVDGVSGVERLDAISGGSAIDVTAIAYDSRRVGPGTLFCCVPGTAFDGHDFAGAAVAAGAVALVVERPLALAVPQVDVRSVRQAMPLLAARLFDYPSRRLVVAGVTGTNG